MDNPAGTNKQAAATPASSPLTQSGTPNSRTAESSSRDDAEPELQRRLGWHEKFNVMRHNVGEAPVIVLGARLRVSGSGSGSPSSSPSGPGSGSSSSSLTNAMHDLEETLRERIEALLRMDGNGLLGASVWGSTTTQPRFKLWSDVSAAQVLRRKVLRMDSGAPADQLEGRHTERKRRQSLMEAMLEQEFSDAAGEFRLEDGRPLWSVALYEMSNEENAPMLALSVHHVIADGKGCQAILNALLFGQGLSSVDTPAETETEKPANDSKKSTPPIPPSSNGTLPMAPPFFSLVLPLALAKYVMPSLAPLIPPKLRRTYNRKPAWPALRAKPNGKPSRQEPALGWLGAAPPVEVRGPEVRVVRYGELRTVEALKAAGKAHGVSTVHATLHTGMILALGAALFPKMAGAHAGVSASAEAVESAFKDYVYASETPVDHRRANLGHGTFTGNFIGAAWWRSVVSGRSSFWALARDYAAVVSDERKRREALWSIGLLKYLKASPVDGAVQPGSTREMNGARPATGWERWWTEKSSGRRPHRVSAGLSNLGVSRIEGDVIKGTVSTAGQAQAQAQARSRVEVEEVAMTQCPSAIGPAIDVDVMGYRGTGDKGGLSLSVSWRRGVLDEEVTREFVEALEVIGPLIAEGRFGGEMTVAEGVALVRSRMAAGR